MTLALTDNTQEAMAYHTLLDMLTYRRPSGSGTEREFCVKYIEPLGVKRDKAGNYWLDAGDGKSRVLYSCHYDTVHHGEGRQTVACSKGVVSLADPASNCLGADDTVGVWLMREMILANVPGLYIFHAAEEIGGVGSQYIAGHYANQLKEGILAAIAFDRRGKCDVITHQFTGRTASDEFAYSLAAQLGLGYAPSARGIFTDTANYAGIIPECSNVSVGYVGEHSSNEVLDINHAMLLRARLICGIDESKLVIARDPAVADDHWSDWYDTPEEIDGTGAQTLLDVVKLYPDVVADWLEQQGYDVRSFTDELNGEYYGKN